MILREGAAGAPEGERATSAREGENHSRVWRRMSGHLRVEELGLNTTSGSRLWIDRFRLGEV